MNENFLPNAEKYQKAHKQKSRWYKIVMCLAVVVVFCTTYALILPAITMEKETYCGIEDHVHEDACYERQLTCANGESIVENVPHEHTDLCYQTFLICEKTEHTHEGSCYINPKEDEKNAGGKSTTTSDDVSGYNATDNVQKEIDTSKVEETITGAADNSALQADAEGTDSSEQNTPIQVDEYIKTAKILYKTDKMTDWANVEGATDVPGDASFKLEIGYDKVPISNLENAGYRMTYKLPELFRNAVASGDIVSGNETVGTIVAKKETVTLTFDKTWVDKQKENKNQTISGDFYVTAKLDISHVPGDGGTTEIVIGNVKIDINFEGNLYASSVDIGLTKESEKKLEETKEGLFLTYTVTVKSGIDPVKNIVVKDVFENNEACKYIESYVVSDADQSSVTIVGKSDTSPGTLTWDVGDMAANETRTLTYKVKLKDNYKTFCLKQNVVDDAKKLVNTASVSVKGTPRDDASTAFVPKYSGNIWKFKSNFVPDEKGGGTITYTVLLEAPEENNIPLENVLIKDALDGSLEYGYKTDEKYRKHMYYDEKSFVLWDGGHKGSGGTDGLTESEAQGTPVFPSGEEQHNTHFQYFVGSMKPGEMKTLSYTVVVEPGVYVEAGNNDINITNRAFMYAGSDESSDGRKLNQSTTTATISKKTWSRKIAGDKEENEQQVQMSEGTQYAYGENGLLNQAGDEASFTVPAGSYQYQVLTNEAGDWDLSSAVMKDAFQNEYMKYVGYVRVDAYTISNTGGQGNANAVKTDQVAIGELNSQTPVKTAWVKVDGRKSFEFELADIGMGGAAYAYLLTYYAVPDNLGDATTVVVANHFDITGTVGIYGQYYKLTGINVSATVNAEGSNYFAVNKRFWYYDKSLVSEEAAEGYKNGALYWIVQVDGNRIPAGTEIKDKLITDQGDHKLYGENEKQFIGVYRGSSNIDFTEKTISSLENIGLTKQSLKIYADEDKGYDTETAETDFQCWNQRDQVPFKFNKEVTLNENESLYFIISTSPNKMPEKGRDSITFENTVQSKDKSSTDWITHNTDSYTVYGNDGIFKEVGQVFTYDKTTNVVTTLTNGSNGDANLWEGGIPNSGTYAAWQIQINHFGTLSGRYRLEEQIPEGMELVYVRYYWKGGKVSNQMTIPEISDLEEGWEHHSNIYGWTTNYYTKGQKAIWEVDGLVNGGEKDQYAVEFQVLCRVTDPEVLQGGKEKTFDNKVTLLSKDGIAIDDHRSAVTLKRQTMEKTGIYDSKVNSGRYPFQITINELGEDLVKGSDQITLVDEMCEVLTVDTTSIKVINTKINEPVTNWTSSVDGKTLRIILPDNLPLTITYEAKVNAAPGQQINISNKAYWEGYAQSGGSSVKVENFSYSVGGSVESNNTPTVKVIKLDQNNNQIYLEGAEFTLTKVEWKDNQISPVESDNSGTTTKWTGSTETDGTVMFGTGGEKGILEYNTVYCLQETKAPAGYVLDGTPHYFAVAKKIKTEGDTEGQYPKELNEWAEKGVKIYYEGYQYEYHAYNHKGEISVTKEFQNADGSSMEQVNGTYTFGIYNNEITSDALNSDKLPESIKIVSIKFTNNSVEPKSGIATFKDLDLDKTYYIYELDDAGKPVLSSDVVSIIDGKPFRVSYESGSKVTISSDGKVTVGDGKADKVTVINRINYAELPQTGGMGVMPFKIGGILLILIALSQYLYIGIKRKTK